MMSIQISAGRKVLYYGGMLLTLVGLLLFLSNFLVIFLPNPRDTLFLEPNLLVRIHLWMSEVTGWSSIQLVMARALGGMFLAVIGQVLMRIGARGLAGSGLILSPNQVRQDLKPWSKMAGGMVQDALEDFPSAEQDSASSPKTVIQIRCTKCQALNDEAAKFCDQCGAAI